MRPFMFTLTTDGLADTRSVDHGCDNVAETMTNGTCHTETGTYRLPKTPYRCLVIFKQLF